MGAIRRSPLARLAFLGTPSEAAACLRRLAEAGHEIAIVVTRPDARAGRGSRMLPSPVRQAARELDLMVSERAADVTTAGAEIGVVVAYGRMIPASVLQQLPMVNVHFSLLPRWRGAAPVEWAILAGDAETGVSLMAVDEGLDTGDVYDMRRIAIAQDDTASTLRSKLTDLGIEMLLERLEDGAASLGAAVPQAGEATYARKIVPDMLELDWSRGAEELERVVRVGGAWTLFRGQRLKVSEVKVWPTAKALSALPGDRGVAAQISENAPGPEGVAGHGSVAGPGSVVLGDRGGAVLAACGKDFLELARVQMEGRKPVTGVQWWMGARPRLGDVLGLPCSRR